MAPRLPSIGAERNDATEAHGFAHLRALRFGDHFAAREDDAAVGDRAFPAVPTR
ncbi:hypothetical protein [Amaricoccus sp. W119]|uniref:hypothetical protein n=1 Tax=Amaricoccus sp. W119 TaxID=3391833 RepID=UPI0039A6E1C4